MDTLTVLTSYDESLFLEVYHLKHSDFVLDDIIHIDVVDCDLLGEI